MVQEKNKRQTSIVFEHVDKKWKVPQDSKSVKVEDAIVAAPSSEKFQCNYVDNPSPIISSNEERI